MHSCTSRNQVLIFIQENKHHLKGKVDEFAMICTTADLYTMYRSVNCTLSAMYT